MTFDKIWNDIFKNNQWGRYPAEDLIRFSSKYLNIKKNKRKINIIELGCGPGGNLWYFAKNGFSINGIDGSKIAIKNANKYLDKMSPNWQGELEVADLTNYSFKKDSYDAVVDNEFSCCLDYKETKFLYEKLYHSLKNNGKIFLRTFAIGSYGYKSGKKISYNTFLPSVGNIKMGTQRFSSKRDINLILHKFEILSIEKIIRTINNSQDKIIEWIVVAKKNV